MKAAFIGSGSWGTAVASLMANKNECETMLWARRGELAETINLFHENPQYLPDIPLPENLVATDDLEHALAGAEVVVMGVPSHGFRSVLRDVAEIAGRGPAYVSLTKGLEVDTKKRMSQVLNEELDGIPAAKIAVLTGPNLAKEVVKGFPAACTIACAEATSAERLRDLFHTPSFRCYSNTDVVGCELGGAV